MTRDALGAIEVGEVMASFESALAHQRDVINRLNVYPVPDGDTGTNMHLTLESVVKELESLGGTDDMGAICKAISHGSLMGARGNSGVILCQILRGLSVVFAGSVEVGATELANGLAEADTAARAGVMRPVEGTILTVARVAAEAAALALGNGNVGLLEVCEAARAGAVRALHETPELLEVLAKAGVVDAGGAGLVLLFDAFLHVIDGRDLPASLPLPSSVVAVLGVGEEGGAASRPSDLVGVAGTGGTGGASGEAGGAAGAAGSAGAAGAAGDGGDLAGLRELAHDEAGIGDLRYEVMYFLEAPDEAVAGFREVWAGIGDSIVVVGGDGLWNCHIHTNDVGAAIEAALDAGRPRQIRVTDLLEQVEEESWVRQAEADRSSASSEPETASPPVTSVVAVATGDGIRRIFHSLGVRHVVAGGQSMNPSTAQILEVIDSTPGAEVVLLPNNKNIFAVGVQACQLAGKPARMVETEGIQEGFAALLEYDPQAGAEENARSMAAEAARVVAGEVTKAVRSAESSAGPIVAGDWIGVARSGIEAVGASAAEATCKLLAALLQDSHEIVTIIEGVGATAADTRRVTEWLAEQHPGLSVELHRGGQALYPYLVAAE